jgi:hypothetical protein
MRSTNTWRRSTACWEGGTGNEFSMGAESETNTPFGAAPVANDVDGQINKYISGYSQPVQSTVAVNYTTQAGMSDKALSPVVCRFKSPQARPRAGIARCNGLRTPKLQSVVW